MRIKIRRGDFGGAKFYGNWEVTFPDGRFVTYSSAAYLQGWIMTTLVQDHDHGHLCARVRSNEVLKALKNCDEVEIEVYDDDGVTESRVIS